MKRKQIMVSFEFPEFSFVTYETLPRPNIKSIMATTTWETLWTETEKI